LNYSKYNLYIISLLIEWISYTTTKPCGKWDLFQSIYSTSDRLNLDAKMKVWMGMCFIQKLPEVL
jgi:hypothetical protein